MARTLKSMMEKLGRETQAYLRKLVSKPAKRVRVEREMIIRKRLPRNGRWVDEKITVVTYRLQGAPVGKPPRLRTGNLQRNIRYQLTKLVGRAYHLAVTSWAVRKGAPYGLFLETGWFSAGLYHGFQGPRPYLIRGFRFMERQGKQIVSKGHWRRPDELKDFLVKIAQERRLKTFAAYKLIPRFRVKIPL